MLCMFSKPRCTVDLNLLGGDNSKVYTLDLVPIGQVAYMTFVKYQKPKISLFKCNVLFKFCVLRYHVHSFVPSALCNFILWDMWSFGFSPQDQIFGFNILTYITGKTIYVSKV